MKKICNGVGCIVYLCGIIATIYVGGWLMIIKPIIDCCVAFNTGTLSGIMIGISILKIIFASFVSFVVYVISTLIATVLINF